MPVLAYWKIRGLAQPIRLLLHYCGEEFEDKVYESKVESDGSVTRNGWKEEKFQLGLDFPNLPYYIDDNVKISQSNAILKHIGRKYNLVGKNLQEEAVLDMLQDEIMDLRNGFVRLCYGSGFESKKPTYLETVVGKLGQFETFLAAKSWLVGDHITYVDFHLYEMICAHQALDGNILKAYPKLEAYKQRFEALPKIKAYMESDKYLASPFNSPMASFTG